jgi:hypothetical protein
MNKQWFPFQGVVGWILTVLLGVLFVGGGIGKLVMTMPQPENAKISISPATMFNIGCVELACGILFLIPQTSIFGLALLTAYMGGACATHVFMGENCVFQVIIGILLWIAMVLRYPGILRAPYAGREPAVAPSK